MEDFFFPKETHYVNILNTLTNIQTGLQNFGLITKTFGLVIYKFHAPSMEMTVQKAKKKKKPQGEGYIGQILWLPALKFCHPVKGIHTFKGLCPLSPTSSILSTTTT